MRFVFKHRTVSGMHGVLDSKTRETYVKFMKAYDDVDYMKIRLDTDFHTKQVYYLLHYAVINQINVANKSGRESMHGVQCFFPYSIGCFIK